MQEKLTYMVECMLTVTIIGSAILAISSLCRTDGRSPLLPMPEIYVQEIAAASLRSQRFTAVHH